MKHLKPCPFCGGTPHYESVIAKGHTWLRCSQCFVGIDPQWYGGALGVVEASWNRRADEGRKTLEPKAEVRLCD